MTTTKPQLNARVPAEVRDKAVERAKELGLSLNGYIERLIVQDGQQPVVAALFDGDGQGLQEFIKTNSTTPQPLTKKVIDKSFSSTIHTNTDLDVVPAPEHPDVDYHPVELEILAKEAAARERTIPPPPDVRQVKTFAKNCSIGTLHWKYGPGNPCKRCGGEC